MTKVHTKEILQILKDDPQFRQAVWRRLPEAGRFSRSISNAFRHEPDLFVDSKDLQKRLFQLIDARSLGEMVKRARHIAPAPSSAYSVLGKADGYEIVLGKKYPAQGVKISVEARDLLGFSREVSLEATSVATPVALRGLKFGGCKEDSFRFADAAGTTTIALYEKKRRSGISIPAHILFRLMVMKNIMPRRADDTTVVLMHDLSILDAKRFGVDPKRTYSGYAILKPEGSWVPLADFRSIADQRIGCAPDGIMCINAVNDSIDSAHLKKLISNARSIMYRARAYGLTFDPLTALLVNPANGEVIVDPHAELQLFDVNQLADEEGTVLREVVPADGSVIHYKSAFAPNIAIRVLNEEQLARLAENIFIRDALAAGKPLKLKEVGHDRIMEALFATYGLKGASRRMRALISERVRERETNDVGRENLLAAFNDYVYQYLERTMQALVGVEHMPTALGTVESVMDALALYVNAAPDELLPEGLEFDEEGGKRFEDARQALREFMSSRNGRHQVEESVGYYLRVHKDWGLSWFAGQTLPLIALHNGGRVGMLYAQAMRIVNAFKPDDVFSWDPERYEQASAWVRTTMSSFHPDPSKPRVVKDNCREAFEGPDLINGAGWDDTAPVAYGTRLYSMRLVSPSLASVHMFTRCGK